MFKFKITKKIWKKNTLKKDKKNSKNYLKKTVSKE